MRALKSSTPNEKNNQKRVYGRSCRRLAATVLHVRAILSRLRFQGKTRNIRVIPEIKKKIHTQLQARWKGPQDGRRDTCQTAVPVCVCVHEAWQRSGNIHAYAVPRVCAPKRHVCRAPRCGVPKRRGEKAREGAGAPRPKLYGILLSRFGHGDAGASGRANRGVWRGSRCG